MSGHQYIKQIATTSIFSRLVEPKDGTPVSTVLENQITVHYANNTKVVERVLAKELGVLMRFVSDSPEHPTSGTVILCTSDYHIQAQLKADCYTNWTKGIIGRYEQFRIYNPHFDRCDVNHDALTVCLRDMWVRPVKVERSAWRSTNHGLEYTLKVMA